MDTHQQDFTEDKAFQSLLDCPERVISEWLPQNICIVCGDWKSGAIMEIIPEGNAVLSEAKYDGCFAGMRDILLPGHPHHLHVNLGLFKTIVYEISPSVCYGYRPAFNVGFTGESATRSQKAFMFSINHPYDSNWVLKNDAVSMYFRLFRQHRALFGGERVQFQVSPVFDEKNIPGHAPIWNAIVDIITEASGISSEKKERALSIRPFKPGIVIPELLGFQEKEAVHA